MALYPRICRECGRAFEGGPRATYCPECRAERRREASRRCKARRKRGLTRPIGSTDECEVCGREYVVQGGRQRYCPACAADAVAEADRKQGLEYYRANREQINAARNEARRKGESLCEECGRPFDAQGSKRLTCSDECWRARKNRMWREAYRRRMGQL